MLEKSGVSQPVCGAVFGCLAVTGGALCVEGADSASGAHLGGTGTAPGTSGWEFQKQRQEQRCA